MFKREDICQNHEVHLEWVDLMSEFLGQFKLGLWKNKLNFSTFNISAFPATREKKKKNKPKLKLLFVVGISLNERRFEKYFH